MAEAMGDVKLGPRRTRGVRIAMRGSAVTAWARAQSLTPMQGWLLQSPALATLNFHGCEEFEAEWLIPVEADSSAGAIARAPIAFAARVPGGADLLAAHAGDLRIEVDRIRDDRWWFP